VEWVTIDKEGDLFYTCPRTSNINKVSSDVLQNLAGGQLQSSALHVISEKTFMKETIEANKTKTAFDKLNPNHLPTDAPPVKPHSLQIYEASLNPHVAAPAAIRADNGELFWTNVANGTSAGTVVKALVHPENATGNQPLNLSKPFPAEALTSISAGAYGLAKTKNAMFFTRNGTLPNTGLVSAILLENPTIVLDFVKTITNPRGLAWDHDQTMYVTDKEGGCVWSFPIGRMMTNAPLEKVVSINGAYDLGILSSASPAFAKNKVTEVEITKVMEDIKQEAMTEISEHHTIDRTVAQKPLVTVGVTRARDKFLARKPVADDELSSLMQLGVSEVEPKQEPLESVEM